MRQGTQTPWWLACGGCRRLGIASSELGAYAHNGSCGDSGRSSCGTDHVGARFGMGTGLHKVYCALE